MTEAIANVVTDTNVKPVVASIAPAELQTALGLLNTIQKHHDAIAQAVAGNIGNDDRAARLIAAAGDVEGLAANTLKLHALLHGSDATGDMVDVTLAGLDEDVEERPEPVGTATTLENFAPGKAVLTEDLRGKVAAITPVPVQNKDTKGEGAGDGTQTGKTGDGKAKTQTVETATT